MAGSVQPGGRDAPADRGLIRADDAAADAVGVVVNKAELAFAFRTSETTVDKWIREPGFPILERGANGKSYQFSLSDVVAWRARAADAERVADKARRSAIEQLRLDLIGTDADDETAALPPKERKALFDAQRSYLAAAEAQRRLIPAADVVALLDTIFAMVREALEAQPDRVEQAIGLDPAQIGALVALNDSILSELQGRISRHDFAPAGAGGGRDVSKDGAALF
jgi:phage terminase Nu1 subunit (DNA packaging protein)